MQAPSTPSEGFPVVGIGASAGGLDACRKLLDALPVGVGMAFILVQHLDPTHESMMVELLADHTSMTVRQAADGMRLEPDHLYVIPPGSYLAVGNGALHLTQPEVRHGARLPFDFLLRSLAEAYGERAVCVVLSGTGSDGSLGLRAVHENGGLVIVQDLDEAAYEGMPRSAIETGVVDLVLPVAEIGDALIEHGRRSPGARTDERANDWLPEIIDLLRVQTAHDFTLYKPGTLRRRIQRRMAMAAIDANDGARYLDLLQGSGDELVQLAKDLLINVTSFFRDPKVFEVLAETIVPALLRDHPPDQPMRIWIVGCSTGEETYSLAMLFREQIEAAKRNVRLQVFASDVDPDAVAVARDGLYAKSIEADVSPERLTRFFSKEDQGYRVSAELRSVVVFAVQDVLSDPPFSRLDLVSCRNLLIYLGAEAQAKVLSVVHFALRENGVLLLGGSETAGAADGRFTVISKPERLYRRVGRNKAGEFGSPVTLGDGHRLLARAGHTPAASRQTVLAEVCRRLVIDNYAPAAVLINSKLECLYSLGPTDRYLRVSPGQPTHDLLAMARQDVRTKLRAAIQKARQEGTRVVLAGGHVVENGNAVSFSIDVQPVASDGEDLLLICFVDEPKREPSRRRAGDRSEAPRVAELEQELSATRTELQAAIRNLEISNEDQKAINEEALSAQEEFQSTNEELLTSKEELQSLNEELTALNSQLQETLERQRTMSNDLQNVLYSTDVATLFLDSDLEIRFFTPAVKGLFNVIPGDLGRPLADLHSMADDRELLTDARTVLETPTAIEREIETRDGAWYIRRILPYRTQDNGVEGVVITFADITERRRIAYSLEAAKQQAELATVAKTRFLAAASHDLRQPLQTLALLQGLLSNTVKGEVAHELLGRVDKTLGAMSGMLNTLLDINSIEAGAMAVNSANFQIGDLLARLADEFTYYAEAQGLTLRAVPCSLSIRSDPNLLEQMLRNLLSNALKYTKRGRVLLGCRRRAGVLSIEVWDTGVGIPDHDLQTIFEEYRQLDNVGGGPRSGLGLGLSIVRRLGELLGHRVDVRSRLGYGSVFAVGVMAPATEIASWRENARLDERDDPLDGDRRAGEILIVEDDEDGRELLEQLLRSEGHHTVSAADGVTALDMAARGAIRPDLVVADYNLPNGIDGLQFIARLRKRLNRQIPVIMLTGDISIETLRDVARHDCIRLSKPVLSAELTRTIQQLLTTAQSATSSRSPYSAAAPDGLAPSVVFIVDDDNHVRGALRDVLEADGFVVEDYETCEEFLAAYRPGRDACLLVDAYLPGMSGLELLQNLGASGHHPPAVMITGHSDVQMAIEAMKAGASDFIEKPVGHAELLASIERTLDQARDSNKLTAWREAAASRVAGLTDRERQIMDMVLAGAPSKNIAADLGISQRTVEHHRASVMTKTGAKSLPALARLALAARSRAQ